MNLYEIDKRILELANPETGEIDDWEALEALQMERTAKIENVVLWIKDLAAQAEAIRQEETALARRRKELETQIESKRKYVENALQGNGFETARCKVSFRRSNRVEITDEQAAVDWAREHERYDLIKYTLPSIRKTEITPLLKQGEIIPGAEIVSKINMGVS